MHLATATAKMRRPPFVEGGGLASIAEMEAGFSTNKHFLLASKRNAGFMAISSQRFGLHHDSCSEEPRHFLDACHLCRKTLGQNTDIFMYRGDTPFCSEGCRQEQIDKDEALEKSRLMSIRVASSSSKNNPKISTTNKGKSHNFNLRAGSAVVAG